jgi:hypothetical protein
MTWPNWRNPAGYPDPDLAPLERWAWEFLRRCPEYQADYRHLCDEGRFYTVPREANDIPYSELGLKVPTNDAEDFEALFVKGTSPLARKLEQKWGIKPIASPETADAWKWLSMEPGAVQTLGEHSDRIPHPPLRKTELLVRIDVAGPIDDQLRTAADLLKLYRDGYKIKPYGEREQRHLWAVYLRILDARQQAKPPGWGTLAAVLSAESPEGWTESRARRAHGAACALRDGGWRFIAGRHPGLEKERARNRKRKPTPGK